MWLVEEGICSNAETEFRTHASGNRRLRPAGRVLLDSTGEGVAHATDIAERGRPHTDIADRLGRNEAQVSKKPRREIESGRMWGFPDFGNLIS